MRNNLYVWYTIFWNNKKVTRMYKVILRPKVHPRELILLSHCVFSRAHGKTVLLTKGVDSCQEGNFEICLRNTVARGKGFGDLPE